jgi:hypothetical protein
MLCILCSIKTREQVLIIGALFITCLFVTVQQSQASKFDFGQADGEQAAAELHADLRLHVHHLLTHMSVMAFALLRVDEHVYVLMAFINMVST